MKNNNLISFIAAFSFISFFSFNVGAAGLCPSKEKAGWHESGQKNFNMYCASCHGEKGDGNGPAAVALNPKPRNFAKDAFKNGDSVDQIYVTLTEGLKEKGPTMVGFPNLKGDDGCAVAYYVKSFRKKK